MTTGRILWLSFWQAGRYFILARAAGVRQPVGPMCSRISWKLLLLVIMIWLGIPVFMPPLRLDLMYLVQFFLFFWIAGQVVEQEGRSDS